MNSVDILNQLEKKAKKGKANKRELQILIEAYEGCNIPIPKAILKQI